MIIEFKEDKIKDIALAQVYAWKKAFKGILSEKVLANLVVEEFEDNWKKILTQKKRRNYIWLTKSEAGVGFISFGRPKNESETAHFEIYGLYVHPEYWGKGIGNELMKFAIEPLMQSNPSVKIILWTMSENELSKQFYEKIGFKKNGKCRISKRNMESFEEIQFEIRKKALPMF